MAENKSVIMTKISMAKRASNIEKIKRKKAQERMEREYELDEVQFTHNTNVYMDATSKEEKLAPLGDVNMFAYGAAGVLASITFWSMQVSTQMFENDNFASHFINSTAVVFTFASFFSALSSAGELQYTCAEQTDMILRIMSEQGYKPTEKQREALYKELIALRRKPKAWFVSLGRLIKKDPQVLTKIHSVAGFDKFLLDKMYPESMALKYIPVKTR